MSRDTNGKSRREIKEDSEEEETQNKHKTEAKYTQKKIDKHTEVRRGDREGKSNPGLMLSSSIISVITLNQLMMMMIHT